MTLNVDEFTRHLTEFLNVSSIIGDDWHPKKSDSGPLYLERRITVPRRQSNNELSLDATLDSFCVFVYHIIYSQSYSVPVLYCNAYQQDGKPLSLDEIWEWIPECYKSDFEEKKWHMVTQQDHPVLGIPCFMVHPCHTADLMNLPYHNYISTWLSLVGPLVGLKLSLQYAEVKKD